MRNRRMMEKNLEMLACCNLFVFPCFEEVYKTLMRVWKAAFEAVAQ